MAANTFEQVGARLSLVWMTSLLTGVQSPVPDAGTRVPVITPAAFVQRLNPVAGLPGHMNCSPPAATLVGATSSSAFGTSAGAGPCTRVMPPAFAPLNETDCIVAFPLTSTLNTSALAAAF